MTEERPKPILLQGNEAIAEGALAAGMRFFGGYPISPSSEVAETLARRLPQVGGTFIQMEDEIASISSIIGASIAGVKSMTATSGPGYSLMQEGLGFAAITETPCVIVNVQRMGPSTGVATAPAQADVMQARYGTHGPHPMIALSPSTVKECFDVTVKAFNLSEKYRTPVVILADAVVGHLREVVTLPRPDEIEVVNRMRPDGPPGTIQPFAVADGDGVPTVPDFGTGYRFHVTGLFHDETGFPTTNPVKVQATTERLVNKVEAHTDELTEVEYLYMDDAEVVVVSFGCSGRSSRAAVKAARARGIKAGLVRLITIWPFPEKLIQAIVEKTPKIVVAEMNLGEVAGEIRRVTRNEVQVTQVNRHDGMLLTTNQVLSGIEGVMQHA
ncbi:MAG TPA: 2-oxoacid:acceptor oxidoreductase subunit alpha [Chloroflexota bacterium]|nr:2-oxoacid:acceptor oxidoreductase subunit alpha [Chloroflexota bacterium]